MTDNNQLFLLWALMLEVPLDWEEEHIQAEEATDRDAYFWSDPWTDADHAEYGYAIP